MDLAEGEYARVAGSVLDPDKSGDFLVLLNRQYSDPHWLVDVGDGDEFAVDDFFAVRMTKLRRVFDWFGTPESSECQDICGRPVSLWPRGVPCHSRR